MDVSEAVAHMRRAQSDGLDAKGKLLGALEDLARGMENVYAVGGAEMPPLYDKAYQQLALANSTVLAAITHLGVASDTEAQIISNLHS